MLLLLTNIQSEVQIKKNIQFNFTALRESIYFSVEFNTNMYSENLIDRICNYLVRIYQRILESPNNSLSKIDLIEENERNQILFNFNNTDRVFPASQLTVHSLFTKQAELTPDEVALIFHDSCMTYKELNNRSEQLACYLNSSGVGLNSIVGVYIDRSFEMMISILGILKAGAAYLPIDTGFPEENIEYILSDSGARHVITLTSSSFNFCSNVDLIYIDNLDMRPYGDIVFKEKVPQMI